jgi:hypothetical protein
MSNKGLTPELLKTRLVDDFFGDSLDPRWNGVNGSDGTVVAPGIATGVAAANGVALLSSGTNVGGTMTLNGVQLESQLNWLVSKGGLAFEARVRIPGIATNAAWFLGYTDSVAVLEMPFTLAAGNVLTSTASNAVGFLYDTASDDPDNWWAVGVANDVGTSPSRSPHSRLADSTRSTPPAQASTSMTRSMSSRRRSSGRTRENSATGVAPLAISDLGTIEMVVNSTGDPLMPFEWSELVEMFGDLSTTGTAFAYYTGTPSGTTEVATYPVDTTSITVQYYKVSDDLTGTQTPTTIPARFHKV